MFKKVCKIIVLFTLALTIAFTSFACGGSTTGNNSTIDQDLALNGQKADNSPKTIEVLLYSAGYGVEWLNRCAKEFMKTNDYSIKIQELQSSTNISTMISAGPSNTTVDLLIVGQDMRGYVDQGPKMVAGYDICLENLDEVYASKALGDEITIEEKMNETIRKTYESEIEVNGESETHYYGMPWTQGIGCLMYNKKLFEEAGLVGVPRTTEELFLFCETLKSKSISPIVYSAADDYIQYLSWVWWAQYSGQEGIDNFYNGKLTSTARPEANPAIFDQEGMVNMLRVYEQLLNPSKSYVYKYVESLNYSKAQALFLTGNKEYGAIMPNGTWVENEMLSSNAELSFKDILPMQTPVVSALVDRLSFWSEGQSYDAVIKSMDETTKKTYDDKLCQLIDYVDGKITEKPAFATEEDVAIVKKARLYIGSFGGSWMSIPVYATAKEGAKEFLKFMASDTAIKLYLEASNGNSLPYKFDYKNWSGWDSLSDFAKEKFRILETGVGIMDELNYRAYRMGGLRYDAGLNSYNFAITFGSQTSNVRYTTEECVAKAKDYYNTTRLTKLFSDIGLI